MNEIKEIKLPEGVNRIAVKQHDDRIVFEFMPKKTQFKYVLQPKFKVGDSVKIKDGISSKTHRNSACLFLKGMDKYIGKKLIVAHVTIAGLHEVRYSMTNGDYYYDENWLEPYSDEPKNGDLAIFWDNDDYKEYSSIRSYDRKGDSVHYGSCHYDSCGISWRNAIKFESKEQFEKILRGEI